MGVGELLDASITLTRRNYRALVMVAAWAIIPAYVLVAVLRALLGGGLTVDDVQAAAERGDLRTLLLYVALNAIIGLAIGVASAIATAAITIGFAGLIEPGPTALSLEPGPLYRAAAARVIPLLLLFTVLGLSALLLFAPIITSPLGVYVSVRWALAGVVVMAKRTGPIEGLRRSWQLTRGAWWHTLGVLVAGAVIFGILSSIAGAVGGVVAGVVGSVVDSGLITNVLGDIASAVGAVLVTPFSVAYLVLLYYELRARTEGYDLQQRAAQVASFE